MKRTAVNTIHVYRDGKKRVVKPGETFDFTKDEIEDIRATNPRAIRTPVVEGAEVEEVEDDTTGPDAPNSTSTKATKASGGNKTPKTSSAADL